MTDTISMTESTANIAKKVASWSIGILRGETPFDLRPIDGVENPVISARNVSDIDAEFVADPFMVKVEKTWHMFFEVMNARTGKGEIGWATSEDGLDWKYQQIVLEETFHLSYPCVFAADGQYYMVPESYKSGSIRLYRADPFPTAWSLVGNIIDGAWVDPTIFEFDGRWWIFACPAFSESSALNLFYSESPAGPWREHPLNPIVEDNHRKARPAGRVTAIGDKLIRFAQDCHPNYGTRVRAFEISDLTTSTYREREAERKPILSPSVKLWNRSGMHHVDPHVVDGKWLACADGWRLEYGGLHRKLNYYRAPWPLRIEECPWDMHFVEYLRSHEVEGKVIFHFGTGEHHFVGRDNHERGNPNEIIGITTSPEEYEAYIDFIVNNPVAANYYKVMFADIYTLSPRILPKFDLVTLFHICYHYDDQQSGYARLDDVTLVDMFLSRLNPGGKLLYSMKIVAGLDDEAQATKLIADSIINDFVSRGKMVIEGEYEGLLICGLPPDVRR